MSEYPSAIYSPRTKNNKDGVVYTPANDKTFYADDITKDDDEIVAIETELGTAPSGSYATVKANLVALWSAISSLVVSFLNLSDTPSSYSGKGGQVVAVNAGATALEFIELAGSGPLAVDGYIKYETYFDTHDLWTLETTAESYVSFYGGMVRQGMGIEEGEYSTAYLSSGMVEGGDILDIDCNYETIAVCDDASVMSFIFGLGSHLRFALYFKIALSKIYAVASTYNVFLGKIEQSITEITSIDLDDYHDFKINHITDTSAKFYIDDVLKKTIDLSSLTSWSSRTNYGSTLFYYTLNTNDDDSSVRYRYLKLEQKYN